MKKYILLILFVITFGSLGLLKAQTNKWMSVGALHNWYSIQGCEVEEGWVQQQQYGLQWPAIYAGQDAQAAKALWIGTTNYQDANGTTYPHKVVHVGPRVKGLGEFFPVKFMMYSKFAPPEVLATGNISTDKSVENDSIDPNMKPDRMIDNIVNTSIGITMRRKIIGFSQQDHDNYIIQEYTFTNTGLIDDRGNTRSAKTLTGVYFYFQYRLAVNNDVRSVIGNGTSWGMNSMNDVRGDTMNTDPNFVVDPSLNIFFPTSKNYAQHNDIRAQYTWHGKFKDFQGGYDNTGGPIWNRASPIDTTGRLGASQFVGVATIYAQKSPSDTSDDRSQPSTTSYEGSDDPNQSNNTQFNPNSMSSEYGWMSKGHIFPRHAEKVGAGSDPALGTGGGYSSANGYGPYTLGPNESIKIVMVEAVAGSDRETNIRVGRMFKQGLITATAKNDSVFKSRDMLFTTFRRAISNYASGYTLALGPPPPQRFEVNSGAGKISLSWGDPASGGSPVVGYKIYRAVGRTDSTYYNITTLPSTARAFADTSAPVDVAHYYYLVSIAADSSISSRYYTQIYDAVFKRLAAATSLAEVKSKMRIVPNPYNISATPGTLLFPGQQDKIAFKNIPGICTIKIYSELGELIKTLDHNDGTGTQDYDATTSSGQIIVSGVYIAVIETPAGERAILKFVVIR